MENQEKPSFEIPPEKADSPDESPFWTGPGYRGEYNCPHGVGHGNHIHGCDGCCQRDDFPMNKKNLKEEEEE